MKAAQRKQLQQLWQQRINDWKQSGLNQTQWCKQHQLKVHQLSYWQRKLSNEPDSKVIPLAILSPKSYSTEKLILHIDNIRIEATQQQTVALIKALQAEV